MGVDRPNPGAPADNEPESSGEQAPEATGGPISEASGAGGTTEPTGPARTPAGPGPPSQPPAPGPLGHGGPGFPAGPTGPPWPPSGPLPPPKTGPLWGILVAVIIVVVAVGAATIGVAVGVLLASGTDDEGPDGQPHRDELAEDSPIQTGPMEPDEIDAPSGGDLAGMTEPWDPQCPPQGGSDQRHLQWTEAPPMCIDPAKDYTATLHTDRGDIVIEFDVEAAPLSVNNFVFLARWHFYDGIDFHRVVPGFVIQAGDPVGDPPGTGGPGYTFEDELPTSEPYYPRYSVATANPGEPDSNGSQFFIVSGDTADVPPAYSRFGQITDTASHAIVDEIDATGAAAGDATPRAPTIIEGITITER